MLEQEPHELPVAMDLELATLAILQITNAVERVCDCELHRSALLENIARLRGEGVPVPALAILATEDSGVVAREDDHRLRAEPFGWCLMRAVGVLHRRPRGWGRLSCCARRRACRT